MKKTPFEQFLLHYRPQSTDEAVLLCWQVFTGMLDQRQEHTTLELLRWIDMYNPARGADDYQFAEEGFIALVGDGLAVEFPVMESVECSRQGFRDEFDAFIAAYEAWRR
jgi:hypothetical protein